MSVKDLFDAEKMKEFDYVQVLDADGNSHVLKKETLLLQISSQMQDPMQTNRSGASPHRRDDSPMKSPGLLIKKIGLQGNGFTHILEKSPSKTRKNSIELLNIVKMG